MLTVTIFVVMIVLSSSLAEKPMSINEYAGLEKCQCRNILVLANLQYLPLCANNGITYSNPAVLICAKECLKRDDLEKLHDGPCEMKSVYTP